MKAITSAGGLASGSTSLKCNGCHVKPNQVQVAVGGTKRRVVAAMATASETAPQQTAQPKQAGAAPKVRIKAVVLLCSR
jgi:hypothetical protein